MQKRGAYDLVMRAPLAAAMLYAGAVTAHGILAYVGASRAPRGLLFYSGLAAQIATLAYVLGIAALTLARLRPLRKLPGLAPRAAALAGSCLLPAALGFVARGRPAPAREILGAALIMAGMAAAVWVLGRLGRSFSVMPEARRLVTTGPYRVVRHPLYLAEAIQALGILAIFPALPVLVLLAAQLALQVLRIRFEERVLAQSFPEAWARYARRTRARLVPGVY